MRHILYKTTNLVNGKFYIGMHTITGSNDSYLGSGKVLKAAIKKYGRENFERIVLEECSSRDDLDLAEQRVVTLDLIANPLCMNIKVGGQGGGVGGGRLKGSSHDLDTRRRIGLALKGKKLGPLSKEHREKIRQNSLKLKHSKESRAKIGHASKVNKTFNWEVRINNSVEIVNDLKSFCSQHEITYTTALLSNSAGRPTRSGYQFKKIER